MNSRREAQTTYPDRPKYYHTRILHQKLIGETVKHEHELAYCISFTLNKAIQGMSSLCFDRATVGTSLSVQICIIMLFSQQASCPILPVKSMATALTEQCYIYVRVIYVNSIVYSNVLSEINDYNKYLHLIKRERAWVGLHFPQTLISKDFGLLKQLVSRSAEVWGTEDLMNRAFEWGKEMRRIHQDPAMTLLFGVGQNGNWGPERDPDAINAKTIAEGFSGKPKHWGHPTRDEDSMREFYRTIKDPSKLYIMQGQTIDTVLLARAPILDHIALLQRRADQWGIGVINPVMIEKFQQTRSFTPAMIADVTVKEVFVGRSTPEEVADLAEFVNDQHRRNQLDCPFEVMSMDVEEIRIKSDDYQRIVTGDFEGESLCLDLRFGEKAESKQLPVRMMIGDGLTWAAMITIPVDTQNGKKYIPRLHYQPELIEFLLSLPAFVGVGIQNDVIPMEDFIRAVTGSPDFRFTGFVEIGALAVLNGWNARYTHMSILSYQLMGGAMHKKASCGDGSWSNRWNQIRTPLKAYCLADVKFGYQAAVILYGAFIMTVFPDPDIVLSILRCNHAKFGHWVGSWLLNTLNGVEVDSQMMSNNECETYRELLKALTYRTSGGVLTRQMPSRIIPIKEARDHWSSLTNGGPRFLHEARLKFLINCAAFHKRNVFGWADLLPDKFNFYDEEQFECALYGCSAGAVEKLDFAVPAITTTGLCLHPDLLASSVVEWKVPQLSYANVLSHAGGNPENWRIVRETVYEWVRLHVNREDLLEEFFLLVGREPMYRRWLRSYYVEAKNIYRRCTGLSAPRVEEFDEELRVKTGISMQKERELITQLQGEKEKLEEEKEKVRRKLELEMERLQKAIDRKSQAIYDRQERILFYDEQYADGEVIYPTRTWRGQLPGVAGREKSKKKLCRLMKEPTESVDLFVNLLKDKVERISQIKMVEDDECLHPGRYSGRPRGKKRRFGSEGQGDSAHGFSYFGGPGTDSEGEGEDRLVVTHRRGQEVEIFTLG